jgi:release factor glutamine methyltransferase
VSTLLSDITNSLTSISDTPALDASVLLAHVLKKPRTWVLAHPELTLSPEQQNQLNQALSRLESGEPFPYVLGHWEFFGLDFEITPDVLIPRPETELLVEKAIAWLQHSSAHRTVADIGTGSGVIAISIATNVQEVEILATDISPQALEVAKQNAEKYNLNDRIKFIECDLLPNRDNSSHISSAFSLDLICANLPYIPTGTLHALPIYGREPMIALDGGNDGLDLVRRLLKIAPNWLAPHGLMLLEIEATRGADVLRLAMKLFPGSKIQLHQDLTAHDRLLEIAL